MPYKNPERDRDYKREYQLQKDRGEHEDRMERQRARRAVLGMREPVVDHGRDPVRRRVGGVAQSMAAASEAHAVTGLRPRDLRRAQPTGGDGLDGAPGQPFAEGLLQVLLEGLEQRGCPLRGTRRLGLVRGGRRGRRRSRLARGRGGGPETECKREHDDGDAGEQADRAASKAAGRHAFFLRPGDRACVTSARGAYRLVRRTITWSAGSLC